MHASSFALSQKAPTYMWLALYCITYSMTSLKCRNLFLWSYWVMSGCCWHKIGDCGVVQKEYKQTEIASLLDLDSSVVYQVISRYRQCSSVENRPQQEGHQSCHLRQSGYCSTMSKNLDTCLCRKLQAHLIKADLDECLNVIHNVLFVRKVIKEGWLGRQFDCVY